MINNAFHRADFLLEVLNAVPAMLLIVDSDVRIYHINEATAREFRLDRDKVFMMQGGEVLHCIHATEAPGGCGQSMICKDCVLRNSVHQAMKEQQVFRACAQLELMTKDSTTEVQLLISASPLVFEGEALVLLALENITELKQIEDSLHTTEVKLRNITSVMGEGVYVLDRDLRLTFLNPEAEKLLGWTEKELLGKYVHDVFHKRKADGSPLTATECPEQKTVYTGTSYRSENEIFVRKDGTTFPVALVSTPLIEHGNLTGCVAVFRDVTEIALTTAELKRLNELLEHRATTDALTDICNRLKFSELLIQEMREFRRYGHQFSLIMFDIDNFKKINDREGHQAGDSVLRELARLVKGNIRAADIFGRWGGEEFMILSTHTSLDETKRLAQKLRELVEAHRFDCSQTITCSFGVTQCIDQDTFESFTNRADMAMYRAKAEGRNRVNVIDAET
jgi:diguanylate cyclase (GGDEF)-like protein/PAS domain S-box-containing protein